MFSDQTLISPLFPAPIYFLLLSLHTIGCRAPAHWLCELTRNSVPCQEDPVRKECEMTVGEREKPLTECDTRVLRQGTRKQHPMREGNSDYEDPGQKARVTDLKGERSSRAHQNGSTGLRQGY